MANQMIALQARAPQAAGRGNVIAQNAQMINMMTQQRAAERQAALANQKMALEAELAGPRLAKAKSEAFSADQKALTDFFDVAAKVIGLSKSPEDVRFGADMLKQRFDNPIFAQMIDQTIQGMPDDPQAFGAWRNQTKLETLDAKDQVPYFFEQVKSKEIIGEGGDVGVLTTGGLKAPTIKTPRTLVPAPARTGTVNDEPSVPVDGGVGGPVSADDAERFIQSFPKEAQAAIRQRIEVGAPGNIPMGLPVETGLVAGERGGVGGPYEAADDGYVEAATPFRAKNPMQAPMPTIPPTADIRRKAVAERQTPTETYQEKRAEKQALSDVDFLNTYESSKADAQNVLSVIDQMVGDLNVKDGKIVQGKRPPHPGFESVIGAGIPGLRFIPGTQSADFDAFMEQVEGGAFLDAYKNLRGTGQITEKEGEKATSAISRMKRSQSEAGFIKAAREFEGMVRSAVQRADERAARLRGQTPTAKSGGGKRLKYNPATGELE